MRRMSSVAIREAYLNGKFKGSVKVRGFRGYYISPKLELISFTNQHKPSGFHQYQIIKPYRKKRDGKTYGARWVSLMKDDGTKTNVNFDQLLEKTLGKQKLEKIRLGELY